VAAAVELAMKSDPRVAELSLTATAERGTVTIAGVAESLQAKRTAGEVAQNVAGVERVLNFVKVRPELALTDEEIEDAARAALARDPIVAASDITLLVDDSTAKLYGVVDTRFERAHAADVVGKVNGVVDIRNYLATYEAIEGDPSDARGRRPRREDPVEGGDPHNADRAVGPDIERERR
jgi:osmotically-inducible protein OsmY